MAEALPDYPDSDFSDEEQTSIGIKFNEAADHVRKTTFKLDNNQLLQLYALFKQGTDGNCNIPKPGWLDGRGRKKWEAWKSLENMPIEQAQDQYIALLKKFDPGWCDSAGTKGNKSKESWVTVSSLQYSPEPELLLSELSLLDAAREDCSDRVTELLENNPILKYEKDEDGLTALHWAADRNATKSLLAGIKGGCLLNEVDGCGQTPLHYAVSCGHLKATQILLKAGALIVKDHEGNTPIDLATDEELRRILESA